MHYTSENASFFGDNLYSGGRVLQPCTYLLYDNDSRAYM